MKIKFTKDVVFKDMHGTITKVYNVGDVIKATAVDHERGYFVTAMGGIYFHEAEEVKD